ncbi:MAG: SDR family NAD(P)-dependent oxidoreductase [Candidatus Nitrosotenuis sp.]
MEDFYKDKRVLITGSAGTIGREIARQMLLLQPKEIRLMDNNESGIFFLMEEFKGKNVNCFLGDIRDRDKIEKLTKDIHIIIHAAAFKHVILSEYNPFDVVQTNIIGVENIIMAATKNKVNYLLFTSSDKAVNPTNVMGASKLMGEKLVTAANSLRSDTNTIFSSTRFGNVIGSRGSVVPLFMKQIRDGGPVTITDKRMTRFIMTPEEAARLVLKSIILSRGGEVFVTKMPVVRIIDLAEVMIELLAPRFGHNPTDIEITEIGIKPGEKMYEELISDEETRRSIELRDMFVITPAFKSIYRSIKYEYPEAILYKIQKSYNSNNEKPLTKEELKRFFIDNVLDKLVYYYG